MSVNEEQEKREWYRNYSVCMRNSPSMIMAMENLIVKLMNRHNESRTHAILRIRSTGVACTRGLPVLAASGAVGRSTCPTTVGILPAGAAIT